MMHARWLLLLASLIPTHQPLLATESAPAAREAVVRAVKFLNEVVVAWDKREKCVSCHNALPIIWSLREASLQGYTRTDKNLETWTKRSLEIKRQTPPESLAYLILGRDRETDRDIYLGLAEKLAVLRQPDGTFPPGGQRILEKRRTLRSREEANLWSRFALATMGKTTDDSSNAALPERFELDTAHATTEILSLKIMIAREAGQEVVANTLAVSLVRLQNEDGGWGWKKGEISDVISTGQSLYALGSKSLERASLEKAYQYLVSAQKKDGSWTANMPVDRWDDEMTKDSVYWGTAWAVLGLTRQSR